MQAMQVCVVKACGLLGLTAGKHAGALIARARSCLSPVCDWPDQNHLSPKTTIEGPHLQKRPGRRLKKSPFSGTTASSIPPEDGAKTWRNYTIAGDDR